ncbi:MAG: hypothetical protein Q7K57_53345 [Burkholderiaceae bacterium]|nr:hypothetical protein [Burkholderiaceae bacterium]
MSRGAAYNEIRNLGQRIAADPTFSVPDVQGPEGLRLGFLDRAADPATGLRVAQTPFNHLFRNAWPAHDELFSTASTRHFVSGLLANNTPANMTSNIWMQWRGAVDLLSMLRIPTASSGFSTATELVQHPTAVGTGLFSLEGVAGPHGRLDAARVRYIGSSVKAAHDAGMTVSQQFLAGARAAIEFTLNYFTAAITAANVQEYSTQAGIDPFDPTLQPPLAARERMKEIYPLLGGVLRDPIDGETTFESLPRPWQQGILITAADPYPLAPPSPLREGVGSNPAAEGLPELGQQQLPIAEADPFPVASTSLPSQGLSNTSRKRDRRGESAAQSDPKVQRTAAERWGNREDAPLDDEQAAEPLSDMPATQYAQNLEADNTFVQSTSQDNSLVDDDADNSEPDQGELNIENMEWPTVPTDDPGAASTSGEGVDASSGLNIENMEFPVAPTELPETVADDWLVAL